MAMKLASRPPRLSRSQSAHSVSRHGDEETYEMLFPTIHLRPKAIAVVETRSKPHGAPILMHYLGTVVLYLKAVGGDEEELIRAIARVIKGSA